MKGPSVQKKKEKKTQEESKVSTPIIFEQVKGSKCNIERSLFSNLLKDKEKEDKEGKENCTGKLELKRENVKLKRELLEKTKLLDLTNLQIKNLKKVIEELNLKCLDKTTTSSKIINQKNRCSTAKEKKKDNPRLKDQGAIGYALPNFSFGPELDVDNMTYEQLLELEERVGYVSKGLSRSEIDSIPLISFSCFTHTDGDKCAICQEEYQMFEQVRQVKCGHMFHKNCLDDWLYQNNSCPFCKDSILK